MTIEKGQKLLIVRYSDFLYDNCISEHISVIKEKGYCWFGKIGKQKPSLNFCNKVLKAKHPMIVLHSAKKAFICNISEITFNRPEDGCYPSYYNEFLFEKSNEPSAYFKITSCAEISKSVLNSFIICSSRNRLPEALRSSMNSLFLAESNEVIDITGISK